MRLFEENEEEIMCSYIRSEVQEGIQKAVQEAVQEASQKARQEENIELVKRMLKRGKLSVEEIAEYTNLPMETILELQKHEEV